MSQWKLLFRNSGPMVWHLALRQRLSLALEHEKFLQRDTLWHAGLSRSNDAQQYCQLLRSLAPTPFFYPYQVNMQTLWNIDNCMPKWPPNEGIFLQKSWRRPPQTLASSISKLPTKTSLLTKVEQWNSVPPTLNLITAYSKTCRQPWTCACELLMTCLRKSHSSYWAYRTSTKGTVSDQKP